jgi:hypothetical protein
VTRPETRCGGASSKKKASPDACGALVWCVLLSRGRTAAGDKSNHPDRFRADARTGHWGQSDASHAVLAAGRDPRPPPGHGQKCDLPTAARCRWAMATYLLSTSGRRIGYILYEWDEEYE